MTEVEKYDALMRGVLLLREAGNEFAEDTLLDQMDAVWWRMSSAERAERAERDDAFGKKLGRESQA